MITLPFARRRRRRDPVLEEAAEWAVEASSP
jgi:hypothetical protein